MWPQSTSCCFGQQQQELGVHYEAASILSAMNTQESYEEDVISMPISKIRKLRTREVERCVQILCSLWKCGFFSCTQTNSHGSLSHVTRLSCPQLCAHPAGLGDPDVLRIELPREGWPRQEAEGEWGFPGTAILEETRDKPGIQESVGIPRVRTTHLLRGLVEIKAPCCQVLFNA